MNFLQKLVRNKAFLTPIVSLILLGALSSSYMAKGNPDLFLTQINLPLTSRNMSTITGGITSDDNDILYSAWTEYGDSSYLPMFAKSYDYGESWTEHTKVAESTTPVRNDIVECNGLLATTFTSTSELNVTFSSDYGANWSNEAVIDGAGFPLAVSLDAYTNSFTGNCYIYATWLQNDIGLDSSFSLNFSFYDVVADTWSTPYQITTLVATDLTGYLNLQTTADSTGNLHVIYADQNGPATKGLFYIGSSNAQNNEWDSLQELFVGQDVRARNANLTSGTLVYDNGEEKVFVVASINPNSEVVVIEKIIGGNNWSQPAIVNQPNTLADWAPVMTITDEGVAFVVWEQDLEAHPTILKRATSLDGSTWGAEEYLDTYFNRDIQYHDYKQITDVFYGYSVIYHRENNQFSVSEPNNY